MDRCEAPPQALGPAGLFVRRSGDDVLLDFDTSGLGADSIAVDVYRGTIELLGRLTAPYDHDVMTGGCGVLAAPFVDVAAAAAGVENHYYLATRGCPDACSFDRLIGGLGMSSTGPRPDRAWPREALTCR